MSICQRGKQLFGVPIVLSMKPSGTDKWTRQVYNAEMARSTAATSPRRGPNALKLEGCALGGLICKGQTWTRVR
jgi:uncharacterized protein (DUF2147 family)